MATAWLRCSPTAHVGPSHLLASHKKVWASLFAHGYEELLVLCKTVTGLFHLSFGALSSMSFEKVEGWKILWAGHAPVQASGCNTQNKKEKRSSLPHWSLLPAFFHMHIDLSALAGSALFIPSLGYLSHQLLHDVTIINILPFMACSQCHQG